MKKKFILIQILVLIFAFSGCSTNSNPTAIQEEPYFYLKFVQEKSGDCNNIIVTFTTNDWDSYPKIIVNGYNFDGESFRYPDIEGSGRSLQGQKVIPYSKTCNYDITVEGKSTIGSIVMPSLPYNVFCNEIELEENSYTNLDFTDSLNFSWSSDSSDGFLCYLSTDGYYSGWGPRDKEISFVIVDSTNYTFVVKSVNASHLNVDAMPDILEYYNEATIFSETYFRRYNISF